MSLQYLKKELSYEVDVLNADKHESLLQDDNIIFDGFGQACPKYADKFAISLQHLKKKVRNEVRDLTALAGSNTAPGLFRRGMWLHAHGPTHMEKCLDVW